MQLNVAYDFQAKQHSCRATVVMDHFGIGFETGPHVIAQGLELPIEPGDVACFTGASGSGKSSLMRAAAKSLSEDHNQSVVNLDDLELGNRILIEALPVPVYEAMGILSACGLSEARLLLRTPKELSDGQRYRFRLALAMAQKPAWIVADEFSATLDRTLAKVVAFNLKRLAQPHRHRVFVGHHARRYFDRSFAVASYQLPIGGKHRMHAPRRRRLKKSRGPTPHQLCKRHPHHHRYEPRLAVFRWVALSIPQLGIRETRHAALARRRTHRNLHFDFARDFASATQPVLQKNRAMESCGHQSLEQPIGDALPRGAASGVSRSGLGGGVYSANLRNVPVALD